MKNRINLPVSMSVAAAPVPTKRGSPLAGQLAAQYRTLSADALTRWSIAHDQTFAPLDRTPPPAPHGNAWTAFYSCNAVLAGAAMNTVLTPHPVNVPANLPPLTVNITLHNGVSTLALVPTSDAPYPAGPTVAVWATAAVPQGRGASDPSKPFRNIPYRLLGTVTGGIPLSGLDVTALYRDVFSSVPASCKIGLKLMAINPGGWHSEAAYTFGLTPLLSLSAAGEDTDDPLLASGE